NRQKFTVSEKKLLRKTESDASSFLDIKVRRKISSNPLLQKNLNFLQTYNNIFRRPSCNQFGDAETYFRQTLRNEPFDLIRDLNLSHLVRPTKSLEGVGKRKPRSHRTLLSPKSTTEHRQSKYTPRSLPSEEGSLHFKELYSKQINNESSDSSSESEDKDYFSPKTEPLIDLEEVEENSEEESTARAEDLDISDRLDVLLKEEKNIIMAEEEDAPLDEMEDQAEENDATRGDEEYNEYATENEYEGMGEEEDDEMKEVEKMIERASKELQQVVDENKDLMETLNEDDDGEQNVDEKAGGQSGDGPPSKFDPIIDMAVLRELEAAENEAKQTAKIIEDLKMRVTELSKKDKMTEAEAKELENKNQELKAHMAVFEEKTKRIQQLIGQTIMFGDMPLGKSPWSPQVKHNEDVLPKVVVCGFTENNIPKILICDDKKKRCTPKSTGRKQDSPRTEITKKLNECYCMQEKLAAENADLEGKRYKLQSDIANQDQTVEYLQRQLATMQNDMRMVCQENTLLNQKLQNQISTPCGPNRSRSSSPEPKKKMPCGKSKGICPADIEYRLQEYSENTEHLEKQLGDMESEVKAMQKELIGVQKEREHLEHHRKMLCRPPPCLSPHPCMPSPCMPPPCEQKSTSSDTQLRELREQYNRLQDDFKNKLTEVAGLRADNEKLKDKTKLAEETKKAAEDKVRELENELKALKGKGPKGSGTREQLIEMEQQLTVAKQRFREAQDELEELRSLVEDQQTQLDDYRNKYLEAQQTVEEQRRQADLMEMENQRISEQVNLEIQRVKNQFQEKLHELMPLPDILKSTQMKLQEAQQMHILAERNNEAIARELQLYKDKITAMNNQMNEVRSDQQLGEDAKASLATKISDLEERLEEVLQENVQLKFDLENLQEKADDFEKSAAERLHEITQLDSQLENLREETARQVARTKDRCEIIRRSMQNQISDMERQLAQSRALAKAAQKDRDDIRQKMQSQISNLNENFEDAQMRIRNLQGHVNFLKNSYGNVYPEQSEVTPSAMPDPCSCSANY
ncbi:unnamed protein product, partial [Phaedon cochleariae]